MTEPTQAEIEAAARAIATAGGSDLDKLPKSHGPGFGQRQMYEAMARAALEAAAEVRAQVVKPRPTIAELEAILRENDEPVIVNPDGSVTRLMPIYGATEDKEG